MKGSKKIISKIHLWLGFTSGLVVFIVAITGCIYAFQSEIQNLTQPYRFTKSLDEPYLPPSKLEEIVRKNLPGKNLHALLYREKGKSAEAIFYSFDPNYYYISYLNPYSGQILKTKNMDKDFFRFILNGHFYLWLPPEIGQPLVASITIVFVVMLISGLFLWWPKNRGARKQRFSIKWKARWRRKNYDLHNVLGFYVFAIAFLLAITGLVWGFQWFANSVYTLAGGDKSLVYIEPASTVPSNYSKTIPPIDKAWYKMNHLYPEASYIEIHPPETDSSPIAANANPSSNTYWQIDYRYFDQYTLKEIQVDHIYGRFTKAKTADKLIRMNYDIHTGAIAGLPGKIIVFFASLICASLPVTGLFIWWGRRKKW